MTSSQVSSSRKFLPPSGHVPEVVTDLNRECLIFKNALHDQGQWYDVCLRQTDFKGNVVRVSDVRYLTGDAPRRVQEIAARLFSAVVKKPECSTKKTEDLLLRAEIEQSVVNVFSGGSSLIGDWKGDISEGASEGSFTAYDLMKSIDSLIWPEEVLHISNSTLDQRPVLIQSPNIDLSIAKSNLVSSRAQGDLALIQPNASPLPSSRASKASSARSATPRDVSPRSSVPVKVGSDNGSAEKNQEQLSPKKSRHSARSSHSSSALESAEPSQPVEKQVAANGLANQVQENMIALLIESLSQSSKQLEKLKKEADANVDLGDSKAELEREILELEGEILELRSRIEKAVSGTSS
jgi:hypothetical protein